MRMRMRMMMLMMMMMMMIMMMLMIMMMVQGKIRINRSISLAFTYPSQEILGKNKPDPGTCAIRSLREGVVCGEVWAANHEQ